MSSPEVPDEDRRRQRGTELLRWLREESLHYSDCDLIVVGFMRRAADEKAPGGFSHRFAVAFNGFVTMAEATFLAEQIRRTVNERALLDAESRVETRQ